MEPSDWVALALAAVAALSVISEGLFGHKSKANFAGLALLIALIAAILAGSA